MESEAKKIIERIDALESELKAFLPRTYTREVESIMDRLVTLGASVYDSCHGRCDVIVNPDCPKYKRSMLRKFRKLLNFEI